ncbi:MAG TPA: MmgE/PrpD family protein [Solirubrobacteraceae bacterium]|nr:MmgE/PrpD family protein [Solirubrobacteraceae bacterium]
MTELSETTATSRLVGFLSDVRYGDLSADAAHEAKRLVLDTLGCALGGRQSPLGEIAVRYAGLTGSAPAEATVVGSSPASAFAAATANGRMAGALDADDTFASAGQTSHHGGSAVMASLALAEQQGSSGKALLAAVAAGYEIGARFGVSVPAREVAPTAERSGKWRVGGGPAGVLAASLAASHILGLDATAAVNALGIAGAHIDMPPLKWFEADVAPMVKSLDVGWNSGTGVASAQLAALGMTGHANILDGETGLWNALGYAAFDYETLTRDLGERWYMLDGSFKRWPCQYWVQPALSAFWKILDEHGLQADEITAVTLRTNTRSGAPRFRQKQPEGFVTCQFNLPHPAAMLALRVPPGPRWFDDEALGGADVRAFREKVEVEIDPEALRAGEWIVDGMIQKIPGSAVVHARGTTFEQRADAPFGAPWFDETRLDDDALRRKVRDMAAPLIARDGSAAARVDRFCDAALALEELEDVRELTRLLTAIGVSI